MIDIVIEAGSKNGTKDSRTVGFDTRSDAQDKVEHGKVPAPFKSFEEFYACAVAHKVVEIQSEIRKALAEGKPSTGPKTGRAALLD